MTGADRKRHPLYQLGDDPPRVVKLFQAVGKHLLLLVLLQEGVPFPEPVVLVKHPLEYLFKSVTRSGAGRGTLRLGSLMEATSNLISFFETRPLPSLDVEDSKKKRQRPTHRSHTRVICQHDPADPVPLLATGDLARLFTLEALLGQGDLYTGRSPGDKSRELPLPYAQQALVHVRRVDVARDDVEARDVARILAARRADQPVLGLEQAAHHVERRRLADALGLWGQSSARQGYAIGPTAAPGREQS